MRHDGKMTHAQARVGDHAGVLKRPRQVLAAQHRDVEDHVAGAGLRIERGGVGEAVYAGRDEADLLRHLRGAKLVPPRIGEYASCITHRQSQAALVHVLQVVAHLALAQFDADLLQIATDSARAERLLSAREHAEDGEHLAAHIIVIAERLQGGGLHWGITPSKNTCSSASATLLRCHKNT